MPITHYGMVMEEVYRIKIYGEIAHPILLQNGLKNLASCYIIYTHFPPTESFNPSVLDLCRSRGGIMKYIETWTI
jgi:hypothetical protein